MYYVVNGTQENFNFYEKEILQNQKLKIMNENYDIITIENRSLGTCDFVSKNGNHIVHCYGNLTCNPNVGKDGTIFTIEEKKAINNH